MRFRLVRDYRAWVKGCILAAGLLAGGVIGCNGQAAEQEPSDAALKDPMNYSPDIPKTDSLNNNGSQDSKKFDKDMNDLINP